MHPARTNEFTAAKSSNIPSTNSFSTHNINTTLAITEDIQRNGERRNPLGLSTNNRRFGPIPRQAPLPPVVIPTLAESTEQPNSNTSSSDDARSRYGTRRSRDDTGSSDDMPFRDDLRGRFDTSSLARTRTSNHQLGPIPSWEPSEHTCSQCNHKTSSSSFIQRCFGVHQIVCPRYHRTLMRTRRGASCVSCIKETETKWKYTQAIKKQEYKVQQMDEGKAKKKEEEKLRKMIEEEELRLVRTAEETDKRKMGFLLWYGGKRG
ncbi:hypothetical protein EX30DRAFT_30699 [Ascodesmis nigricans]|uniref:Uncharacterized protein n=1 Tax=Ascodesmis nigricans TaxID=341454 RepID=A0A4S2N8H8_9PEZI|nr:hypothetical protein EX30DRAFT_30699 [Ascodesmis nigricans]